MSGRPSNLSILRDRSNIEGLVPDHWPQDDSASKAEQAILGYQQQQVHAVPQDPSSVHKAHLGIGPWPCDSESTYATCNDGYARSHEISTVGNMNGGQLQARARAVPYHVPNKFASRAAPLDTIVEQVSHSTLNSNGSLLSLGRFPSVRVGQDASSSHTSDATSHRLIAQQRHGIQEDGAHGDSLCIVAGGTAKNAHDHCDPSLAPIDHRTSNNPVTLHQSELLGVQIGSANCPENDKKLKSLLCGVLQSVRPAFHSRSCSSTLTIEAILEPNGERLNTSNDSSGMGAESWTISQTTFDKRGAVIHEENSLLGLVLTHPTDCPTSDQTILSAGLGCSAKPCTPLLEQRVSKVTTSTGVDKISHLLSTSGTTLSCRLLPSVRPVHPEPRDVAIDSTAMAKGSDQENKTERATRHTFYSVAEAPLSAQTLSEPSRLLEMGRNASSCSTLSTSYSGTVLGVDLDIQHGPGGSLRRSNSPPGAAASAIWFSPQMTELERQASLPDSPGSQTSPIADGLSRSITSSALTALLPIAVASGIVQPYYSIPQITFHSPSGNFIQLQESIAVGNDLHHSLNRSCINAHTGYLKTSQTDQIVQPDFEGLPAVRPALWPPIVPSMSSTPVPPNIRRRQDVQHTERLQMSSAEPLLVLAPQVKGCGGIIRSPSLNPSSGRIRQNTKSISSPSRFRYKSVRSVAYNIRYKVAHYKGHIAHKVTASCTSSRKRSTFGKQHAANGARPTTFNETMHGISTVDKRAPASQKKTRSNDMGDNSSRGTHVGDALRSCFCQPYDDTGRSSRAIAASKLRWYKSRGVKASPPNKSGKARRGHYNEHPDGDLPIARLVRGAGYRVQDNQGLSIHGSKASKHHKTLVEAFAMDARLIGQG
ncbi:hypothetical protein ACN47E_000073 [Coniothyrium glycines]